MDGRIEVLMDCRELPLIHKKYHVELETVDLGQAIGLTRVLAETATCIPV